MLTIFSSSSDLPTIRAPSASTGPWTPVLYEEEELSYTEK
uniref:Uncharacterized protein n=1 Tax=Arundo donax TaxID=35708 RepID=A0A0A9CJ90_ARUDO